MSQVKKIVGIVIGIIKSIWPSVKILIKTVAPII